MAHQQQFCTTLGVLFNDYNYTISKYHVIILSLRTASALTFKYNDILLSLSTATALKLEYNDILLSLSTFRAH